MHPAVDDEDEAPARPVEPEVLPARVPATPTSIAELAALKGEAVEVIEARVRVISTLRRESIRATHPEDWLLFKSPEDAGGQVVGYLQDAGCDRVRDLWGINIYDITIPQKVTGTEAAEFHYLISGSGRCNLTRQVVESMEGGRSSTDDFCRDKTGIALDLAVRKAARANLDGCITRELAGMKNVPVEELKAAWAGTSKRIEQCRLGRGFGSRDERLGARSAKAPDVDPPTCPHCGATMQYRPAKDNRSAFFGCPNWKQHQDRKAIVNADQWVAEQQRKAAAPAPAAAATTKGKPAGKSQPTAAPAKAQASEPLTSDDIFGSPRDREPGEDDR